MLTRMKEFLEQCKTREVGPFLIRLALAIVFIVHGSQKFQNMEGTAGFFGSLGFPAFVAYLIAFVELAGGIAMLLGIFTAWAGILLALVMAGAIYLVKFN